MRQDINLLAAAVRPVRRRPVALDVAVLALLVLLIGVASGRWLDTRIDAATKTITRLNTEIDDVVMNMEERSQFLAQRSADRQLVEELQRREREASDKRRVLELLGGETLGNTVGFSAHLAALGRRHPEGLWLENIAVAEGGRQLVLRGQTLDAGLVPRFLDELRSEPAFAGTAFASFSMQTEQAPAGPLRFALATACPQTAEGEPGADCLTAPGENP